MRARRGICSLLAAAIALSPCSSAFAQREVARPLTVVVTLRDGTVIQGELVEKVPGDHVTVRLVTGEVRTIQAADLADDAPPAPAALPFPLRAPATDEGGFHGDGAISLHVETNKPYMTYLFQAPPGGPSIGWNRLCAAPCDVKVDPNGLYKIGGERIVDSDSFHLEPAQKQTLYVDATTEGVPFLAWTSLVLGVGLTAPAVYLLTRPSDGKDAPDGGHLAGWILLANGVPWLVTSIVLFAVGGTTVKSDSGKRLAAVPGAIAF